MRRRDHRDQSQRELGRCRGSLRNGLRQDWAFTVARVNTTDMSFTPGRELMVQDSGAQYSMDPAHDAGTNSEVRGAAETEQEQFRDL